MHEQYIQFLLTPSTFPIQKHLIITWLISNQFEVSGYFKTKAKNHDENIALFLEERECAFPILK